MAPCTYHLRKYNRSNQSTCIDQRPVVEKGQHIQKVKCLPIAPLHLVVS
ncbi:MAG: hypothetical protein R3E31_05885 [Chloroflexota bacterium]